MHKSERFKLCKCEIMQNCIANKQIIVYSKGVQERYKKGRKGIGMQIIIMNHGRFGEEMIASAEMLFGKIENARAVSLMSGMSIEDFLIEAESILSSSGEDALVLTDLYGGTPCNVAMMLKQKYRIRIVCGVNMPMLIEAVSSSTTMSDLDDVAERIIDVAAKGILQPPEDVEDSDEL